MRIKLTFAVLSLLMVMGFVRTSSANQAIGLNITDLMKAKVVFTGVCTTAESSIKTREGKPGGILVTRYTFDVSDVLKGDVPKTFSFTQWGAPRAEAKRLKRGFIYGPPLYQVGKEYTLFLSSESNLGLRAPIGSGEGKFQVIKGPQGKSMVVNDYGNNTVFRNLPQTKGMTKALSAGGVKADALAPTGPIDYDTFKAIVESLNEKE